MIAPSSVIQIEDQQEQKKRIEQGADARLPYFGLLEAMYAPFAHLLRASRSFWDSIINIEFTAFIAGSYERITSSRVFSTAAITRSISRFSSIIVPSFRLAIPLSSFGRFHPRSSPARMRYE